MRGARGSVCLLYWYKSTDTDTEGGAILSTSHSHTSDLTDQGGETNYRPPRPPGPQSVSQSAPQVGHQKETTAGVARQQGGPGGKEQLLATLLNNGDQRLQASANSALILPSWRLGGALIAPY